jgi:fatty-acid desaturase
LSQVIENNNVTNDSVTGVALPFVHPSKQKIHWPAASFIIGMHVLALLGFFTFTWKAFALFIFMHWLTGGVGITLGFHRLLTHRSFQVPKVVEYFLALCGTLACQGGPITWIATHRVHHTYSDQEKDPHSPLVSFFWAHMGWCLKDNPCVTSREVQARVAPDLFKDPVLQFIEKTHVLWTIALAFVFYALGGWPFVVWGIFVRLVTVYHITWFVNSATHVWGYRTYRSNDQSTNLWWVALLSFGEGWHNNHHAFQTSARHGLQWWEFDITYLTIRTLEVLGIAKSVKIPSQNLLASKKI